MTKLKLFQKEPWKSRPSIFEFIKEHVGQDGCLDADGDDLPDEEWLQEDNQISWASGALDNVIGRPAEKSQDDSIIMGLLSDIALFSREKDKTKFYELLLNTDIISKIDNFIDLAVEKKIKLTKDLKDWLNFLAFSSPDRNAVKFGIAFLGAIGEKEALEKLLVLGKHEEFTLYVSVAIIRLSEDPEMDLYRLARSVSGWGRINLVERLAETENPEIKEWILLDGFRNSIMVEYLALIAAETGGLLEALSIAEPDEGLLTAASEIISALISEGPVPGISSYKDAARTILFYVNHIKGKRDNIFYLETVLDIQEYLSDNENDWKSLAQNGWTGKIITELTSLLEKEINDPAWVDFILEKAKTKDPVEFWKVNFCAKRLKVDLRDILWEKLLEYPDNSGRWYDIMDIADEENIDQILDFALSSIPFKEKCTGPALSMGMGAEFQVFSCIDYILLGLKKFPGRGESILLMALNSPVIRNRHGVLHVLDAWGDYNVSEKLIVGLERLLTVEPDEKVKKRIVDYLEKRKSGV